MTDSEVEGVPRSYGAVSFMPEFRTPPLFCASFFLLSFRQFLALSFCLLSFFVCGQSFFYSTIDAFVLPSCLNLQRFKLVFLFPSFYLPSFLQHVVLLIHCCCSYTPLYHSACKVVCMTVWSLPAGCWEKENVANCQVLSAVVSNFVTIYICQSFNVILF